MIDVIFPDNYRIKTILIKAADKLYMAACLVYSHETLLYHSIDG